MGASDRIEQDAQHTQLQHHMPTAQVKVHTVDHFALSIAMRSSPVRAI